MTGCTATEFTENLWGENSVITLKSARGDFSSPKPGQMILALDSRYGKYRKKIRKGIERLITTVLRSSNTDV